VVREGEHPEVPDHAGVRVVHALAGVLGLPRAADAHDELVLVDAVAVLVALELFLYSRNNMSNELNTR
jgi:hypothetical protein